MKHKATCSKAARCLALILAALLLLTGCAGDGPVVSVHPSAEPSAMQTEELSSADSSAMQTEEPSSAPSVAESAPLSQATPADTDNVGTSGTLAGMNRFAFRFSSVLLEKVSEDANFVCSPYSLWLPLAALANATSEDALSELLASIDIPDVSVTDLNAQVKAMLAASAASKMNEMNTENGLPEHIPLQIANGIFVQEGEALNAAFGSVFAQDYDGQVMEVDFSDADAVRKVNEWASKKTDGIIPSVISYFDPQTLCAIANAIYFSDRWSWEFAKADTKEGIFHAPSGDLSAQYMIHEGGLLTYFEDDELQAVSLGFTMGGGLLVILPKQEDAQSVLTSLTQERYAQIMEGSEERIGTLRLPRFEIAADEMNLMDALHALGVPLIEPDAHLTGLLENGTPLVINEALQSARIRVDEEGTTAAAVTVIGMDGAGLLPEQEPFEMNCDKPFAFVLYTDGPNYEPEGQVLFTGVVQNPQDPVGVA